jgi:trace amine associated receptor
MMPLCHNVVNISCVKSNWTRDVRASLYSLMVLIILTNLLGNLIVFSVSHFKQLHTLANWLIHSMATVDFLLGCLVMPIAWCDLLSTVDILEKFSVKFTPAWTSC